MNLSVSYAHFFLEAPYADVIRTSICILLGVSPPLLFFIMFIDGTWGAFIHVGEGLLKDGRLGILNKLLLTPSHHRVHHAKNPLYMVMPPGWSHTGDHKTAKVAREKFLRGGSMEGGGNGAGEVVRV
jgi:hypothetical protein